MERVTAADYHDLAVPSDPRISPDGDRVAFVRRQPNDDDSYETTVYLVDVAGEDDPRRLTLPEGSDAEPRWSPSGDRIAFASTRGAADDRQQLWVLPVDGGEARRLTDVVGGVSQIAWSPDGERIAFVQSVTADDREADRDLAVPDDYEPEEHPDPRVIDRTVYRSMERYFDGRRPGVYVVDADATVGGVTDPDPAESGAVARVTHRDADFAAPSWGDADTLYYTEAVGDDPDDSVEIAIRARDFASGDDERVHTTTGWGADLASTADGRVAFTHAEPDQVSMQPTDLRVLDAESGAVTDLTGDLDRGLGRGTTPQWGPDAETLYFATPDEGKTALWHVPADGSADPERLLRPGTVSDATVGGEADAGPDSVTVAFAASEWDHPGDAFAYDAAADEATRLTELNADYLAERAVGEPEEIRFESDGVEIQGWLLTPPESADADEPYPLAVEIHGGPHAMWSTSGTMWHEFQTLAARGYAVFWSNPRGSTGYGEEFMQAIERDWGAVTARDVMAGVETVADRPEVDASNAFVTGGSFGGFMTGWIVGQTDYFDAAVSQRGVYDLTGFYGSTDAAYKLVEGDFDTVPSEEPEWLWERSPTGHADDVDTPTLLIHSEDDTRTPICTAELYHRILRKNGVDTRFVRYPREGHELSRSGEPAHVVDRIERIARWFDGYSDHHDAERALDRPEDDGLTAGEESDEAEE
ncbi:S9 family peptidase [Halorubrum tebenquichense]|uniref:Dipeptidyl aminopeptidase/acylaminoacyl peptidase n=1 Tax=Halorubrum tebenquichense DSM 14210 TaxID=1227485 RepID=M0DUV2_9EURY|nr:S9 family peptidase [Halorubrum tebenquichense]ELZ38477.1 dipeptidyl aminopeptidase/acylaminoacyl peptidase [Halorubrum tebenquichense DSM 14210]